LERVREFPHYAGIGKRNFVCERPSVIPEYRVSGYGYDRQDLVILVALPRDKQNVTCVQIGKCVVPRAMLVVLVATAATFHLPTEPIFLILGVDALIDMGRAALNVIGDCLACAVIGRWEGGLDFSSRSIVSGLI
jgi:hypothetical protein